MRGASPSLGAAVTGRQGLFVDFVVAGLGFGALVVVLGFAVRDLGPLFWRPSGYLAPADSSAERGRWIARCQAIGSYSGLAGGAVIVVTMVAVVLGVSDGLGAVVVAVAAVLALALAGLAFVRRLGKEGDAGRVSGVPVMTVSRLTSEVPGEPAGVQRVPRQEPPPQPAAGELREETSEEPAPAPPLLPDLPDAAAIEPAQAAAADSPEAGAAPATERSSPVEEATEREPAAETAAGPAESTIESSGTVGAAPAELMHDSEPPAEPPAGAVFSSPLLADIRPDAAPADVSGGFSSRLLADVEPGAPSGEHSAEILGGLLAEAEPVEPPSSDDDDGAPAPSPAEDPAGGVGEAAGAPPAEDTVIDSRPSRYR